MAYPDYGISYTADYNKDDNETPDKSGNSILVPEIITENVNSLNDLTDSPLRIKAERFVFPLSKNDKLSFVKLIKRFENTQKLTSLSLPQLGIGKRAFIFTLDGKVEGNKNEQTFPKSVWVNPVYKKANGATLEEGFENCPSLVKENSFVVGPVFRFNRIIYRVQDMMGRIMEAEAYGLAARVIQHEVDHLDGRLFVDYVDPERVMTMPIYCEKLKAKTLPELQKGIIPEEIN